MFDFVLLAGVLIYCIQYSWGKTKESTFGVLISGIIIALMILNESIFVLYFSFIWWQIMFTTFLGTWASFMLCLLADKKYAI